MSDSKRYSSFKEFYPYYLTEHQDPVCRLLHFIGTSLVFVLLIYSLATQWWWGLAWIPIAGYGFAWLGHAFFEKNKPATFQYPLWSLMSDFKLYFQMLGGKEGIRP